MAATIILDAGHGGYDNGASYQGRKEKDDVLVQRWQWVKSWKMQGIMCCIQGRQTVTIPLLKRRELPTVPVRIISFLFIATPG